MYNFFQITEGPELGFYWLLFSALTGSFLFFKSIYVDFFNAKKNVETGTNNELSLKAIKALPENFFLEIRNKLFILIVAAIFLIFSTGLDYSENSFFLFFFAYLTWAIALLSIWSLYDLTAKLLSKAGIKIKTNDKFLNIPLGFLIGERLLFLLSFLLGCAGVGLHSIFAFILSISLFWLIISNALQSNSISEYKSYPSINYHNHYSKGLVTVILGISMIAFLMLSNTNFYSIMTSWDNFTHWLIVPHEMLVNNSAAGLYSYTNSVVPQYPPQQTTFGAYILFLWGDSNYSDSILNAYNPLMMLLGYIAILAVLLRAKASNYTIIASLLLTLFIVLHIAHVYRVSFYSDARTAVVLISFCAAMAYLNDYSDRKSVLSLAVIAGILFTSKPYIWPVTFIPLAMIFFSSNSHKIKFKRILEYTTLLLFIYIIEVYIFQTLSPDSQSLKSSGIGGRSVEYLYKLFSLDLTNITQGVSLRPENKKFLYFLLAQISICSFLFFFRRKNYIGTFSLLSLFIVSGVSTMLLIALNSSPGFGNSLFRYLQNFTFLFIVISLLGLETITNFISDKTKMYLSQVLFFTVYLVLIILIPKGPGLVAYKWVDTRKDHLSAFPVHQTLGKSLVESMSKLDKENSYRVLILNSKNSIHTHQYNYLLSRIDVQASTWFRTSRVTTIQHLENAKKENVGDWFDTQSVTHIFLENTEVLFNKKIEPGLYEKSEFIELISTA